MATQSALDLKSLANDLDALKKELQADAGAADLRHLRKIEFWGRLCSFLGYATACILPNPVSALLISQGKLTRWTMMAHHILHQGYDRVPGVPPRFTSSIFARGHRRWVDWFDCILPNAWDHEHNVMHHYRLGETHDPDLVEAHLHWMRDWRAPRAPKVLLVFLLAVSWKFVFYAGNTVLEWHNAEMRRKNTPGSMLILSSWRLWQPCSPTGRILWGKALLPYAGWNFFVLPLLFLPLGMPAVWTVLINILLAECFTNLHSFAVIVTNHSGDDLYAFDQRVRSKGEFYLRQITGSVNFRTGGDWNDFLHGWLNYQIEHHLWPDLTMLQYRKAQPRVKAICERYGISYIQEPLWRRVVKTVNIMTGHASMRRQKVLA